MFPKITKKLKVLDEVGLGYLRLGQSATTLSGGEAQRIKLASYLARETSEKTLFIFDEPTTGLHFDDINKLLVAFRRLIEAGGTVLIIEHNLDVMKSADWIIDLGPEGGDAGGYVVAIGTPEQIAENPASITGQFLNECVGAAVMKILVLILALLQLPEDIYKTANADFDAGRWSDAAAKYELILKDDPAHIPTRFSLAVCYTKTGNADGAICAI